MNRERINRSEKSCFGPTMRLKPSGKILELTLAPIDNGTSDMGCFIINCKTELGHNDLQLKKWLLNNQDKSLELFEQLVVEGQEEGLINNKYSAKVYAHSIFCTFQGLRLTGILS